MRNFITGIFVLLGLSALSQSISIDRNDMPNVNDTVRISVKNSIQGFDPNQTGFNSVWDYRNLRPDSQRVVKFVSGFTTPYTLFGALATYGTRNYTPPQFPWSLIGSTPTNAYYFYKETNNDFSLVGEGLTVSQGALPLIYGAADFIYRFPMNFGNIDSSKAGFSFPIPGIGNYAQFINRLNVVDGSGLLRTPYGDFQTLRVQSQIKVRDSIYLDTVNFGFNIPQPTRYEFKWLTKNKKIPILEIDATENFAGALTIDRVQWIDSLIKPLMVNMASQSSCPIVNEGSITAHVTGGRHPLKYQWNTGDTVATLTNVGPGLYTCVITDLYGQTITISDSVHVRTDSTCLMWITFTSENTCPGIKEGNIVATQYGGRTPVQYLWNTGDTTSAINFLSAGTYTLTVTDKYGRQTSAIATVEQKVQDASCLNIPSAFTPDGDGTNDVWVIRSLSDYPDCKVDIFNQWGSLLFSSKGYTTPWDGRYNGEAVQAGTYYYVIRIKENGKDFTGTVTIIK